MPVYVDDWSAEEEWFLLEGIETMGMGNWIGVSEVVGTKTREECAQHYNDIYVSCPDYPLPVRHMFYFRFLESKCK